ncbi:MAG: 2-amino-4-hydroxy-6-hydroxymethyldihydropteridine diphosphokinase [Verrucomicrobiota bacterium]|nr:2-amino-4-hydroxy-6-hydroxymethyldihydropteridine diphosphokinase [Verrucomicrobiota bacterium]
MSSVCRAGIALGSNLGDRLANLRAAREQITALSSLQLPIFSSAVYETEPIACEPHAPQFLNAVVEIGYAASARELLAALRQIEAALGRPAAHARNTSRTLDLDLLYFDDLRISEPELQLPHPRMHERLFVLQPLSDVRPDLVAVDRLRELAATQPLVRFASEW